MNYKTMLLTSAAVLFASQAMAADLTNPFATPNKGQISSDTAIRYERSKGDIKKGYNDLEEGWIAAEQVEYGITDEFSVNATLTNLFNTQHEFNNEHNFVYNVGAKYNTRCDNVLFQAGVNYETYDNEDLFGRQEGIKTWNKELSGNVMLGYDMGNGLTPYASYTLISTEDYDWDNNGLSHERDLEQSYKLGIHKYTGTYALDLGVRYYLETEGENDHQFAVEAQADYYLKDNLAVGVFGSYLIGGTEYNEVDYDYAAGAHVKVLF